MLVAVLANQRGRLCYLLDAKGAVYTFKDGRLDPSEPGADVFPLRLMAGDPSKSSDQAADSQQLTPTSAEDPPAPMTVPSAGVGGSGSHKPETASEVVETADAADAAYPGMTRCQRLAAQDAVQPEDEEEGGPVEASSADGSKQVSPSIYEDGSYWKRLGLALAN